MILSREYLKQYCIIQKTNRIKASDYIATFLEKKGVKYVFELSGGMITHLLDSLNQTTKIKIISMHHEQSAAFAADAFGRATGLPGVALATSGPGATNLLTGIGSCYFDSSPAIFITGQVNRHELKGNRNIRQLGFQETDIVAMARPITKAVFQIIQAEDIPSVFEKAFKIATEGRPGPVLIDIPMDVQRDNITLIEIQENKLLVRTPLEKKMFLEMEEAFKNSKRPIILAGRGIRAAFAKELLLQFAEQTNIPVVTTLLALDVISHQNPLRVGFIGSYGNRWANIAFGESDLIIVIGSRLDIRQTGADVKYFENRIIYHIDCEEGEINNRIKGCIPIIEDTAIFLKQFLAVEPAVIIDKKVDWFNRISELKTLWPDTKELELKNNSINPNLFMHQLSELSKDATVFLADVGAHQMWAAQSLKINNNQFFYTSGGMGAMGFALPASIGASLAFNRAACVTIIGDGCMQINIQELQTIVRNNLPIKIIVLNNQNLGMIRQFQDSYFQSRYQSTYWGYTAPDFEKIAQAYGINSMTVTLPEFVSHAIEWLWNDTNKAMPVLLQVMIDPLTNVYPKIAFGKPITEMEPFVKPIAMEST